MKYKIIFNEYVNEYGKVTDSHFTIKIEKSFLWFKYWSTVKHPVCDMTGCYNEVTKFRTIEDVQNYIMKITNSNMEQGWNESVVEEARIL